MYSEGGRVGGRAEEAKYLICGRFEGCSPISTCGIQIRFASLCIDRGLAAEYFLVLVSNARGTLLTALL